MYNQRWCNVARVFLSFRLRTTRHSWPPFYKTYRFSIDSFSFRRVYVRGGGNDLFIFVSFVRARTPRARFYRNKFGRTFTRREYGSRTRFRDVPFGVRNVRLYVDRTTNNYIAARTAAKRCLINADVGPSPSPAHPPLTDHRSREIRTPFGNY